jgi:predicted RNA-binding protein Jag
MESTLLVQEAKNILEMMGIHTKEVKVIVDNDLHISILSLRLGGNEAELFKENNSELQRNFSHIIKALLEKKHQYKDLIVDVNGEDKKLIDLTKQKAEIAVERVRFFDKPYEFGYLNAYERMLVHSYLKNTRNIITESQGERRDRRLVIKKQT